MTFYILILAACSTAPVREVKLFSKEKGYDVRCFENLEECKSQASDLCKGQYRIHNILDDEDLSMRFECLKTASAKRLCSEVGVRCIL